MSGEVLTEYDSDAEDFEVVITTEDEDQALDEVIAHGEDIVDSVSKRMGLTDEESALLRELSDGS